MTLDSAARSATVVTEAADRLARAARDRRPCAPVRDLIGASNIDLAYAVQQKLTQDRLALGATIVGRKIGLTSEAVRKQFGGVDRPDFGVLFDDMDASGSVVPSERLLQPKAEGEVAFVLAADLDGDLDMARVRAATAYAVAAIEIVDSRVENWDITFGDTVADNASSGLYVLGTHRAALSEFEPKDVTMQLYIDDELAAEGNGAACLGDPLEALLWLARTACDLGDPLRAGQVVLSGALGSMVPAAPGTTVRADISPLGSVTATFSQ
jgi:2-keto-4-pentenoate hydratase